MLSVRLQVVSEGTCCLSEGSLHAVSEGTIKSRSNM